MGALENFSRWRTEQAAKADEQGKKRWEAIKYNAEPIVDGVKALGMPIARTMSGLSSEGIITPFGFSPETMTFNPQIVHDVKGLWNKDSREESERFDQQLHDDWGVGYTGSAANHDFNSDRDAAQFAGNFIPVPGGVPKIASAFKETPGVLGKIARGASGVADNALDFVLPAKSSGKPIQDMAKGAAMGTGVLAGVTGGAQAYGALRGEKEPTAEQWMKYAQQLREEGEDDAADEALDNYYAAQAREYAR